MNKARRKTLSGIIDAMRAAHSDLETLQEEEQEAYDNLPEGLKQAEQGCAMEQCASALYDAAQEIDNGICALEEAAE